ncbi:MAG: hypothetical protein GWP03_05500 [Proteobacteria bacterium]|nr:hypothetical protein [Pseudomonadota bacterium]
MRYIKFYTVLISLLFCSIILGAETYDDMFVYPPYGHSMGIHKVNVSTYKMVYGKSISFAEAGGISAVKLREKDKKGFDDDDELIIFLADQINGDILYNVGFNKLISFKDSIKNPVIIKAVPSGDVIVGDVGKKAVILFKYRNDSLHYVRTVLHNVLPMGVDFGDGNFIFVSDALSNRVIKVTMKGKILKSISVQSPGKITAIRRVDMWQISGPSVIYAVTHNGKSVEKFDFHLNKIDEYDTPSYDLGKCNFTDIANDFYRNLYLVDNKNSRIVKLTGDLKYVCNFGKFGTGDKEFYYPQYISIWKRFGQIFIVDRNGISYYWMGIDGNIMDVSPPVLTKQYPGITFVVFSTDFAIARLKIYDKNNTIVRSFTFPKRLKPGKNNILWDGKSNRGKICPDGEYKVKMELQPTYSSRGYFKKTLSARVKINLNNGMGKSENDERYEENWF